MFVLKCEGEQGQMEKIVIVQPPDNVAGYTDTCNSSGKDASRRHEHFFSGHATTRMLLELWYSPEIQLRFLHINV